MLQSLRRVGSTQESRKNLDGIDPRSTILWAEAPPILSHVGGSTMPTGGCEQKGRDQCDMEDMKKNHPSAREWETEDGEA